LPVDRIKAYLYGTLSQEYVPASIISQSKKAKTLYNVAFPAILNQENSPMAESSETELVIIDEPIIIAPKKESAHAAFFRKRVKNN
jgi:hypothetical protein